MYVKVRFMTHYLYVYSYNPTYKRNIVAKIIYILLHFVLCKVLSLLKQNTK